MGSSVYKVVLWSLLGAIGVLVIWLELLPRNRLRVTPFIREYARIHAIGSKIALDYTNKPIAGGDLEGLLASGVISPDDAAYLREHQIQFYGFDPAKTGADTRVFETICTNTSPPRRIVGYGDGHTVAYVLQKRD
jgi:hypothetical protein